MHTIFIAVIEIPHLLNEVLTSPHMYSFCLWRLGHKNKWFTNGNLKIVKRLFTKSRQNLASKIPFLTILNYGRNISSRNKNKYKFIHLTTHALKLTQWPLQNTWNAKPSSKLSNLNYIKIPVKPALMIQRNFLFLRLTVTYILAFKKQNWY